MLKKILALFLMLYAAVAMAAVDANKATAAELDAVKGIGPAISGKIVDERKKAPFKDWDDLVARVKGIGEKSAAKLSEAGLTVNGASFKGAAATTAKEEKKDAKATAKEEKKEAKAKAKAEKKEAEAKKDAAMAKAEAKKDSKEAKAEARKEAASAKK